MQPYFFPYIGYFQLIKAADIFIFLDDVQYIQRGWVNRNRIHNKEKWVWLTRSVINAPREASISQRKYVDFGKGSASDLQNKIESAYRDSPNNAQGGALIKSLLNTTEYNVAKYNMDHLEKIAKLLNITTPCLKASEISPHNKLRGQERIIDLCVKLGAKTYLNPIGGLELYDSGAFRKSNLELRFLRTCEIPARTKPESTHLSIIDHLMCEELNYTCRRIANYEIVSA